MPASLIAYLASVLAPLKGYKTYIGAAILLVAAIWSFKTGDLAGGLALLGQAIGVSGLRAAMEAKLPKSLVSAIEKGSPDLFPDKTTNPLDDPNILQHPLAGGSSSEPPRPA